ncbi:MAG: hypothetical protein JWQ10_953 [Herbaspirillum sp.]|jgi:hypothetical protein|nr:hypothetical protein [Herbaspirillum sp.]
MAAALKPVSPTKNSPPGAKSALKPCMQKEHSYMLTKHWLTLGAFSYIAVTRTHCINRFYSNAVV